MRTMRMRRIPRTRAAVGALLLLAGCGRADGRVPDGVVVDTLAGGVVRVANPEQGSWEGGKPWRAVEAFRVGSMDGGGPEMLAAPVDYEVDPLGRVYILEAQAMEVRVFDSAGRHVRTFGRQGGGPGELAQPAGMTWGPDGQLWIVDPGNARYSVFDTTGAFVRPYFRHNPSIRMPWPGMVDSAGRVYDVRTDSRSETGPVLLRFDRAVERAESFALPEVAPARFERTSDGGKMRATMPVPFAPRSHWALAPDGRLWTGFADRYRLELKDVQGRTVRVLEKPFAPVPVSGAEKDSAAKSLEGFVKQGGQIDMSRVPKTKPAFTSLQVDDRGYVWVEPSLAAGESAPAFDVFDPEGRYVGRVALPAGVGRIFNPVVRGDRIYAVALDEMEVPSVVGFRLEGRAAR